MPRESTGRSQCPHYLPSRTGKSRSGGDLAVGRDLTFRYFQDGSVDLREHAYRIIEALSSNRLRRRNRLFGGDQAADGVNDGCDADRGQNLLFAYSLFPQNSFVRVHAGAAAVDSRDGGAPQLKINRIAAVCANSVHAQLRRDSRVLLV